MRNGFDMKTFERVFPNGINPGDYHMALTVAQRLGLNGAPVNGHAKRNGKAHKPELTQAEAAGIVPAPSEAGPKRRGRPAKEAKLCTSPGCAEWARSKGLCSKHYQASRRGAKAAA